MSFTQLSPMIPVKVLDKGTGFALAVIDYGQEHNLIWVVALDDSGEIWCSPNPKVRVRDNWTMGRKVAPAAGSTDCRHPLSAALETAGRKKQD
jgi:hypothetical protein